jgi:hypothetical protein
MDEHRGGIGTVCFFAGDSAGTKEAQKDMHLTLFYMSYD